MQLYLISEVISELRKKTIKWNEKYELFISMKTKKNILCKNISLEDKHGIYFNSIKFLKSLLEQQNKS